MVPVDASPSTKLALNGSEHLVVTALRGATADWSRLDAAGIAEFLQAARYHGVLELLAMEANVAESGVPEGILTAYREATRAQAAYELAHRMRVVQALDALASAGVRSLLLKGTGLAYGLYRSPVMRPRADTDLLVHPENSTAAEAVLLRLGFRRISGPAARFVGYQIDLRHEDRNGSTVCIDLHWRVSNNQVFAWLYEFDELAATSVRVPELGLHAARLGYAESLVVALAHRAGTVRILLPGLHERLIWLYDMWLLAEAMSPVESERFRNAVESKRVVAIAINGLRRCAEYFVAPRLNELIDDLERSPDTRSGADVLSAGTLRFEWLELRALPSSSKRLGYAAGRLAPSPDYMRERYPDARDQSLVMLYMRRLFEGLGRLIATRHE